MTSDFKSLKKIFSSMSNPCEFFLSETGGGTVLHAGTCPSLAFTFDGDESLISVSLCEEAPASAGVISHVLCDWNGVSDYEQIKDILANCPSSDDMTVIDNYMNVCSKVVYEHDDEYGATLWFSLQGHLEDIELYWL